MIKDLNEQIVQKDAFIKKQEDDMKFYKLELINREQSYNQMFGTTPSVGGGMNVGGSAMMGGIGGKQPILAKQSTKNMMAGNQMMPMASKKIL